QDLGYMNTVGAASVSGGTLQLGNATTPASQTLTIKTSAPVGNLVLNSVNAAAVLNTNSLSVINNVAINSGTLNANNLNITLGGNWTSAGSFTPGTSLVTFSSAASQYINKALGETFNHLLFTGLGVKTFSSPVIASGNFSIATSASVDVSGANNQLTVKGNFLNNGYFNARQGLVFFNGTTAQSIGGSSVTSFYDMTLGNSAGASLTSDENLLGTLTLTAGVLNNGSKILTMVSTATATARIAQITGSGDITGNVTVQRFAPGGTTGWAFFGTPISSALTLNDWDDDIPISCPTCPDGSAGGFLSIYTYDETKTGLYDDYTSYIPLNTINDPILPTKGYWVYLGNGQYTTTDITLDVTGTVRKFNYTIPLNYSNYGSPVDDGWNLIQNPYPSPISWIALKGTTSNIDNAIYIYNTDLNGGAGGFATYINGISSPAVGSGGVGNTIPMSQAFYVHSTGATALNAQESVKVAGNPTYLKTNSTNNTSPFVRINLKNATGYNDETVLYTQAGATQLFDDAFDAYKMRGQDPSAPSIALEKANKQFQVNGVAPITGNFSIDLKTLTGYTGIYTLSASGFSTFPAGACISLFDKFTNITTNIKTTDYVFNLSDTTTVARFNLNITINPLTVNASVTQPVCQALNSGKIIASAPTAGPWNYYWTSNGSAVKTSLNKASADTLDNLSGGIYDLEMSTVGMCDDGNYSYQVISQQSVVASFTSADTIHLGVSPLMAFTNLSSSAVAYSWNFGNGLGTSTTASPVYLYSTPGTYTVQLISWSSTGCSDTAYKIITVVGTDVGIKSNGVNTSQLIIKTIGDNEFVFEQAFTQEQSLTFRLNDMQGRLVKDYGTITSKNLILPVDLKNLSAGIYLMRITFGTDQKVIKLPVK
ncbi:MAG: PKD domain-containing protein, partial [Bacteroidia bacterium]